MDLFEDTTMVVALCALALGIIAVTGDSSHSGNNTCKVCGSNQQLTPTLTTGTSKTGNQVCAELNKTTGENHRCIFTIDDSTSSVGPACDVATGAATVSAICQRNDQYPNANGKTCDGQNLDCNATNAGLFSSSSS